MPLRSRILYPFPEQIIRLTCLKLFRLRMTSFPALLVISGRTSHRPPELGIYVRLTLVRIHTISVAYFFD